MYKKLFIISVSFSTDNSIFRLIGKMLAEKCFLKKLKGAYQLLASLDKKFA
jgi:hypothetical protein